MWQVGLNWYVTWIIDGWLEENESKPTSQSNLIVQISFILVGWQIGFSWYVTYIVDEGLEENESKPTGQSNLIVWINLFCYVSELTQFNNHSYF